MAFDPLKLQEVKQSIGIKFDPEKLNQVKMSFDPARLQQIKSEISQPETISVRKFNPLRILPQYEYKPSPPATTTINMPATLRRPISELVSPETDIYKQYPQLAKPSPTASTISTPRFQYGEKSVPLGTEPSLSEKDRIVIDKQKSLMNEIPSTFDNISNTLVSTTKDIFNIKQGFKDIAHTVKVGGAFANATLSTLNPLLSVEQKVRAWENVPMVDKQDPEAVDRVSNAVATLGLIYGGYEGIKAVPELFSWAKNQGKSLFYNITVKEKGLVNLSDNELLNIYKELPREIKPQMARNNERLQNILKTQPTISETEGIKPIPEKTLKEIRIVEGKEIPVYETKPIIPEVSKVVEPAKPITPTIPEVVKPIESNLIEEAKKYKNVGEFIENISKNEIKIPENIKTPTQILKEQGINDEDIYKRLREGNLTEKDNIVMIEAQEQYKSQLTDIYNKAKGITTTTPATTPQIEPVKQLPTEQANIPKTLEIAKESTDMSSLRHSILNFRDSNWTPEQISDYTKVPLVEVKNVIKTGRWTDETKPPEQTNISQTPEIAKELPVLYHGTSMKFDKFLPFDKVPEEVRDVSGQHTFGTYFTDNKELAKQFGDIIMERKLDIKSPFDLSNVKTFDDLTNKLGLNIPENEWKLRNMKSTSHFDKFGEEIESPYRALESLNDKFGIMKNLKKQGYDALIFSDNENGISGKTTVVFDVNKIKKISPDLQKEVKPVGIQDKYVEAERFLKESGIPNPTKSINWIKNIFGDGVKDEITIRKSINILKDGKANPKTQKAFEIITGQKLPATQKEAQIILEKISGLSAKEKKWMTEKEVKDFIVANKGKNVVIDDNRSDWKVGRKIHTSNPILNKIIGIEEGKIVYTRDGHEYLRHLSSIRDFVIDGKSQIGDIQNEENASNLFKKSEQPITPIEKPKEEIEFGMGIPPPKVIREAMNFAGNSSIKETPEKKVSALGQIIKFYAGTKRERFQVLAGDIEKGNKWFNTVRQMEVNYNSIKAMVDNRNKEIFRSISVPIREHIHDIMKGISKDESGKIIGGGLQPSGIIKDKNVKVGQLLTDGRIVGSEIDTNEYQTYRKFDTLKDYEELIKKYPNTKIVFDKFLALNEQIDKTKLGVELPAFSREVLKTQYDIKSTHPEDYRYVPSVPKEQRLFTKIGNLFKSYTSSGRKYKTGILAETGQEDKDLLKTLTSKQNEFAFENLFNNTVGDILATILEPIGKEGVKPGFIEVNLNRPKLKKILELKKDVLKANGIDFEKVDKFQYPVNIEKEFNLQKQAKFSPEMQSVIDDISKKTDKIIGFILSNYLIRPSTAVRNTTSGFLQYNLRTLTHFYEGIFGKGYSPALQDVKALGRAFLPSVWKELPKEILGLNYYSQIPENVKLMDRALVPFRAVETYFKRASFDADLNIFANNKADELNIPTNKRAEFIKDYRINYFQDLFNVMSDNSNRVTFDYSDKPYIIQKISNVIGRGIIPFPNYYYHKMRMYAEHSPLGLSGINPQNYKNKVSKALTGITMFVLSSAIALKVAEERKEKIKELELKKMPYEFDTTGRIKVYADETVERWLRVYDLPFLGDTLYMAEILQKQAGIDDWIRDSLSLGPVFNTMAMFMGLRTKYTLGKPTSSVAGEQIQGFIPFGAYVNYMRILADQTKRQTYAKDYNAFQDFINPIINVIPGVSKTLEPSIGKTGKEKGVERKFDIPSETMKLFFLNVKSVDKAEFEQYVRESFESGKVARRIRKNLLQERK